MFKNLLNNKKNEWLKESYSQCGEDLIIKFIFDQLNIQQPNYLDIGAHHPFYLSNTALFYNLGSSGINIEPDPLLYSEFLTERKKDINLNIGVGLNAGKQDFYIISSPTLNTFSKEEAENYIKQGDYKIIKIEIIEVETINNILNRYCNGKFPMLLSLDAEGIDEILIREIDFKNNYPIVICIETISFSTTGKGIKNHNLINYIKDNGYLVYADTHINTIFIRSEIWFR